jgi:hypothetical protein
VEGSPRGIPVAHFAEFDLDALLAGERTGMEELGAALKREGVDDSLRGVTEAGSAPPVPHGEDVDRLNEELSAQGV